MLNYDFVLYYNIALFVVLLIIAYKDIKKREVNSFWIGILIGLSLTATIILSPQLLIFMIFSSFLLFFSLVFKNIKIGEGDVILFFILIYNILIFQNFKGLFLFLLFILIQNVIIFLSKKKNLAYTPFIVLAYFFSMVV